MLEFGDECLFLPVHKYVKFNILFCFVAVFLFCKSLSSKYLKLYILLF